MKSLILSGGGSFGSFEAGVLYTLFDKIEFDKIYGTSVGALNALLLSQAYLDKSPDIIKELWLKRICKNKHIYKKNKLRILIGSPPYNYNPLKKLLTEIIDFKRIKEMDKKIYLVSVDILSGESIFFSNKDDLTEEETLQAAVASASVPPLFPPVTIRNYYLVDGGVRDNVPIKQVIENWESDSVLMILCSKKEIEKNEIKFKNILGIGKRIIEIMMNEITNNDITMAVRINELLREVQADKIPWLSNKKIIDLETIYPSIDLKGTVLGFKHEDLKTNFEAGVSQAEQYLNLIT